MFLKEIRRKNPSRTFLINHLKKQIVRLINPRQKGEFNAKLTKLIPLWREVNKLPDNAFPTYDDFFCFGDIFYKTDKSFKEYAFKKYFLSGYDTLDSCLTVDAKKAKQFLIPLIILWRKVTSRKNELPTADEIICLLQALNWLSPNDRKLIANNLLFLQYGKEFSSSCKRRKFKKQLLYNIYNLYYDLEMSWPVRNIKLYIWEKKNCPFKCN